MGLFTRLVNGVLRSYQESASITIYDQDINVVSGTPGTNQIQATLTDSNGQLYFPAGTAISLPLSQTYVAAELEVYVNGKRADVLLDYNYVGSGARTQVTFTTNLLVGDTVRFRIDRAA